MKQIKLNIFFIAVASLAILSSCHKDRNINPAQTPKTGLYVLNQGTYGNKNSTLSFYDFTTKQVAPDVYSIANAGAKLGDTGNDLGIYGSKMYIVVNNSDTLAIVNVKTNKLIKKVHIHQCRSVAFYKTNAFVTSYDGVVAVIDTASLSITKNITVGDDPEGLVVANNKLYVANSGGEAVSFGTTVSVIDLSTLTVSKAVTVITNPLSITADIYGNVYVGSIGNYFDIAGGITVINSSTDVVTSQPAAIVGYGIPITAQGDVVYYVTKDNKIATYNAKTQTPISANFITDGTTLAIPFAITGNPATGEIFITDAVDYKSPGILYAFDKTGKKEYQVTVGINPGKIVLLNK